MVRATGFEPAHGGTPVITRRQLQLGNALPWRPTEVAVRCIRNRMPPLITRVASSAFPTQRFRVAFTYFRYARICRLKLSERMRPSRFHVLQNFTSLRALTLTSRTRVRDARVKALTIKLRLLDSVWPASGAVIHARKRTDPSRASPRGRDTVWVVSPTLRGISGGRLPWVLRPACAFGAESPEGGYRSSSVTGRDQLPAIDGQPAAARYISRCVACMAVPLLSMGSVKCGENRRVHFKSAASLATRPCGYNDFSSG
jgi:hypothetical protein